ncbi:MAG: LCP family protein [Halanaerobium sp.]
MADKNTKDNQKSKKKHKWIGIFLIALLLLFIGLAGYYLERDLEPVPDNQIEDSQGIDEDSDSLKEDVDEPVISDTTEEEEIKAGDEESSDLEEDTAESGELESETEADSQNEELVAEDSETADDTADQESKTDAEAGMQDKDEDIAAVEEDTDLEEDTTEVDQDIAADDSADQESKKDAEAGMQDKDESVIKDAEDETVISDPTEEDEDTAAVEEDTDLEEDTAEVDQDSAEKDGQSSEAEEGTAARDDLESETEASSQDEELVAEDSETAEDTADQESKTEAEAGIQDKDEDKAEMEEDTDLEEDTTEVDQDSAEKDGQSSEPEADNAESAELESESEKLSEELEDPSLLDRILSILGLAESDFSQDLNILFVGLDDEESVAVGTIESDSIMLAKLRPEIDKLQIEHIDEDTNYKGQLLREYHNGDIQLAVEEITESEIDYYVYINYLGFERVIDELGGVEITLEQEVKVPGLGLNLKAGSNLLSGKEALNFVRWRDSNSLARFERQKLLINSVMTKLRSNNILFNVKELYSTIVESYNSIETDINPVLAAEIFSYLRESKELELEYIE